MTERVYITLKEAAEHLQARGLTGQTVNVLRAAIACHRLGAVKDGRAWKTTLAHVNSYEAMLWHRPRNSANTAPLQLIAPVHSASALSDLCSVTITRKRLREGLSPKPAGKPKPMAVRRSGQISSQPHPPKPKRVSEPSLEEIEGAKYMALPVEERRQQFRDYLDGKREHWRDALPPKKRKPRNARAGETDQP